MCDRSSPLVLGVPGHHDKRSIQNWGIGSILVLEEEAELYYRVRVRLHMEPEGGLFQEEI